MSPTKIAIIGIGKIAQDQHLPVIAKNADFRLVGVVSQRGLGRRAFPPSRPPPSSMPRCLISMRSRSARRRTCAIGSRARRWRRANM